MVHRLCLLLVFGSALSLRFAPAASADSQWACCLEDGSCVLATEPECQQIPGHCTWIQYVVCSPNRCGPPAGCCLPGGECVLRGSACCSALGGVSAGEGTTCDPAPCATLLGVCCPLDGACAVVTWPECLALWEIEGRCGFMPGWDNCVPNPCPQCCPETCCFPDGSCRMVWGCAGECARAGGVPSNEWACYPDPCAGLDVPEDGGDPPRVTGSWGRIKGTYR